MKYIHINIVTMLLAIMVFAGCSDFLDREPLSSGTEAIFYKTPEHFVQAANALYNLEGWKNYDNKESLRMDQGTDIAGLSSNGGTSAGENDWRWDKPYSFIRGCNILLQKAEEYTGNREDLNMSVGTAYFFRAWQHFYLLQLFGGVPIMDHVPDVVDPVVHGPRNSRYEVAQFIINDLRTAIPLLPKETTIPASDKGKVSQEAAKAFLSRVLLYEATWEKYVPSIGYELDGDGNSVGAGTVKPTGYPSVEDMLTEAKKWSGEVITESEKGTFELWNECDTLSYYYLFSLDDKGGNVSNFLNKGKATNKEFIFSVKYDPDIKRGDVALTTAISRWAGSNISTYLGEMFLCRNGLPIFISSDGVAREKNPEFLGFERFMDEFRNRDYRFISSTHLPDRKTWVGAGAAENQFPNTAAGKPYPDPVYPKFPYDPSDPAFSNRATIYTPNLLTVNFTHNAYGSRKFMPEGTRNTFYESPDYPLIRLAEVHLIYAEAAVELGNGSISDADLNFSINKNRTRARVAPLSNALIAGLWDAGYWDHEQNKTIIKKMNMIDEIRRERACELFGEGFRENDLKRWGIAHINLRGQKLGRFVYGTEYLTAIANDAKHYGEPVYQPDRYPSYYGIYENTNSFDHGRTIANLPGNLLYSQRDYLVPIPLTQIRLNQALTQNPGW
ncbi:MAG: starch-binding protein [Bacteroidetes bacterium GWD2_45_23]|nr:MAG: starch-binding protein [Bacteroidetes bacterium GWC2_46_850]OFX75866.1 MAG: starch-binding protein [Bacteroidetes bacterium GWC1_47_7]OFX87697.1 MAG: starch-binding protein [Bacteroidetes bacterium GWD2_45_23]HBB01328.1 RagB/SusD family nutrient uptake outer membrane protein [Porphyromonadaceae bacterium]HCC19223.1 RagB/SusD family nutrient uptake outer membrane protein [Porphyromonadaceae bacterium]